MGSPTWLSAVPVAVVAAFWVVAPGLLVLRAAGVRGLTAWGAAPLVSVTLIAVSAVLGTPLSIGWGPWVPLGAALLVALPWTLVRLLRHRPAESLPHRGWRTAVRTSGPVRRVRATVVRLRTPRGMFAAGPEPVTEAMPQVWRTSAERDGPDGRFAGIAALAGIGVGAVLGWVTVVRGFGPVDALSSTYDAVFHYSAVAHILGTGDASSLTLGTLNSPTASTALYPGAWHDTVSLVAMSSGAGIPVATNLTAWAVATLVFPLSALLLARQVLGRSTGAALGAPVLATGFTAVPWMLMSFGVLWPNLLGIALLPAAVAALGGACHVARDAVLRPSGALLLFVATVPGLALSHPNSVFSLAVIGLFPVLWGVGRLARRRLATRRFWQPVLAAALLATLVAGTLWMMIESPLLAGVRSFDWPAFTDTPGAIAQVATNSMNRTPELAVLSALVLVGMVGALRRFTTSWLVPAHLASGYLYVLAASREDELTAALTGAWYNDSYRLAAMVPVTGVALAVVGLLSVAELARGVFGLVPAGRPVARRRGFTAAVAAAVLTVLVVASGGLNVSVHADALAGPYRYTAEQLLEPGQRQFLVEAGTLLPPDAVVAENPYTGNVLLYPLTGRQVLFPHMNGSWSPDQLVIAQRLRDAAVDPTVCDAVATTGTTHVLTGDVTFWPWDGRSGNYPGLQDLGAVEGFEFLGAGGGSELWRITACDAGPSVADGPDDDVPGPGPQQ
ncbi:DUF6541 family protein [Pseudonocardia nematodicida]|uniref:DUF6541 family protein n=1 Tax=Pseudonocardia nematodicida TaxID=1206997 RepID=A0ABV1KAN2_9PSEU